MELNIIRLFMHKQTILYSLIITTLSTYGMEPGHVIPMELALSDHNIMQHISTQICDSNRWDPSCIKKDIKNLCLTSKAFNLCYSNEKQSKTIIRNVALKNEASDAYIAAEFGLQTIASKIKSLFYIITQDNASFSTHELKDQWYLNATCDVPYAFQVGQVTMLLSSHETLLLTAIKKLNSDKVKTVINAGISCNNPRCANPLALMANLNYCSLPEKKRRRFYAIVRLLLENNIHPDSRNNSITDLTLLHQAASNNNQRFARTLLRHGANPRLIVYITDSKKREYQKDAFGLEKGEPKGWLQTLVDTIESTKKAL